MSRLGKTFYADAAMIRDAIARRASFDPIHLDWMLKVDVFVLRDDASRSMRTARTDAAAGALA